MLARTVTVCILVMIAMCSQAGCGAQANRTMPPPMVTSSPSDSARACQDEYAALKSLVENNYAGIHHAREHRASELDLAADTAEKRLPEIANEVECTKLLKEWLGAFDDRHLWLYDKREPHDGASIGSLVPSFSLVGKNVSLLTIPSFDMRHKKAIDGLLDENASVIQQREYLIIDLRGNMGGGDPAFESLIQPIYTGPIKTVGWDMLAGPETIAHFDRVMARLEAAGEEDKDLRRVLGDMKRNPGKFVLGIDDFVTRKEAIWERPGSVLIIYDQKCASSCEQFLLSARQSEKVTLIGTTSAGVLDFSVLTSHWLPSKNRQVGIPISRSRRLPDSPVNGFGIAPDVTLPPEILEIREPAQLIAALNKVLKLPNPLE